MQEVKARCLLGHCQCLPPLPGSLGAGMGLWEMPASQEPQANLMLLRTRAESPVGHPQPLHCHHPYPQHS